MDSSLEVYETLPIVPLRDVVVFPHMMMPFVIGRPSSTRALEHALLKDKRIFLAAQHAASVEDPRTGVKVLAKQREASAEAESTMSRVVTLFEQYVKLSNNLHYDAMIAAVRVDDPGKLADTIAAHLVVGVDEKQNLLEIISPLERLNRIAGILEIEVDKLQVDRRVQSRVKKEMEKATKE